MLGGSLGPYALQAEIAACHARAPTAEETDWTRITALYDVLSQLTASPVVELNRAVAHAMAFGPAAGLEILEPLSDESSLRTYHLLPSVRGDLLYKLGRLAEARAEFERAAALTKNAREREFLLRRAAACSAGQIQPTPVEARHYSARSAATGSRARARPTGRKRPISDAATRMPVMAA
jgi:RNA polymerase sigma-70 factor (ECF subfamily)